MQKLLFVDHAFHTSTASSQFFIDLLARRYEVEVLNVAPEEASPAATLVEKAHQADLIVIWQMDYLAPLFLALGKRTIVVPMYDGSATMPDLHWYAARQAGFVNFSFTLHHRMKAFVDRSILVRYFKPPVRESARAQFNTGLHAFLWQRRPEHGINANAFIELLGDQIESFHVHNAPDDPKLRAQDYSIVSRSRASVSLTTWFKKPSDYALALSKANVFIAPRRAEGIGMAMLEAMSRGMLILAHDEPTHNEYISNYVNGILFNIDSCTHIDLGDYERMGLTAYETARIGHADWDIQSLQVLDFIETVPAPQAVALDDPAGFCNALSCSYYNGPGAYMAFFMSHSRHIGAIAGGDIRGRFDVHGQQRQISAIDDMSNHAPWLEGGQIPLDVAQTPPYLTDGNLIYEGRAAVIRDHLAEFTFRTDPLANIFSRLTISLALPRGIEEQNLIISLNNWTLGIVELSERSAKVELEIPLHMMVGYNVLRLQTTKTLGAMHGSVIINSISFK